MHEELLEKYQSFIDVWNDVNAYPTIEDVARKLGYTRAFAKTKSQRIRGYFRDRGLEVPLVDRGALWHSQPIPEMRYRFMEDWTPEDCIASLQKLHEENPGRFITRHAYRTETEIADSTWTRYFGTFHEFVRQAGLALNRDQHTFERAIAKHASRDHYRALSDRMELDRRYIRNQSVNDKIILGASDIHDVESDAFYLRALITAAKLAQPDIINLGGDIFDLPEFGKYGVDPREWDVVGRIKFVHERILKPLREAAPNAQIDFVEGNHEARLLRHMADATPALRAVLSDLHGFTVSKLLGLDAYEVNYIAKADLAAYRETDLKKEIGKSYVIYDEALLVHHFPHAAQWGLPGWNGHHHRWQVSHHKSALNGGYSWMQLGCGHKLKASYTEGEFWSLGFTLCHLNKITKSATFEYINVTDKAVVGGHILHRTLNESITR